MLRASILLLLCVAIATGCGRRATRNADTERELPFRAGFAKTEDPRVINVRVAHRGADVAAVRESVRFEATKYCLLTFGGSNADWVIDPATGDWAFTREGDSSLVFTARCTAR